MKTEKKKRFQFFVPIWNERYPIDSGEPIPCAPITVTRHYLSIKRAYAWLSQQPNKVFDEISLIKFRGSGIILIKLRKASCPWCEAPSKYLNLDELSDKNWEVHSEHFAQMAQNAADKLKENFAFYGGRCNKFWTDTAHSRVVMRCPHCGKDYIAYREEEHAIDRSRLWHTLEVSQKSPGVITLQIESENEIRPRRVEIYCNTGYTKIENRTLFKGNAFNRDMKKLDTFVMIESAFKFRDIYRYVNKLFPKKLRGPRNIPPGFYAFRRLVVQNRFRGYPSSFYRYMVRHKTLYCLPYHNDGICRLPVTYSERAMEQLYSELPLPQNKKLKKLIFENPHKIQVLINYSNLPFTDKKVLYELIASDRCDEFLVNLANDRGGVYIAWFLMSELFGEREAFEFLEHRANEIRAICCYAGGEDCYGYHKPHERMMLEIQHLDPELVEKLKSAPIKRAYRYLHKVIGGYMRANEKQYILDA